MIFGHVMRFYEEKICKSYSIDYFLDSMEREK